MSVTSSLPHDAPHAFQHDIEENEPLINSENPEPNQTNLKHFSKTLVHIFAALKNGKLPSQEQFNRLVKAALKWDLLLENGTRVEKADLNPAVSTDDDKIQDILNHAQILAVSPEELIILEPSAELDPVLQISSELETSLQLPFASFLAISCSSRARCTESEDIAVKVENAAETAQNLAEGVVHVADRVHDAAGIEDVPKDAEHVALNLDFSSASILEAREQGIDKLQGLKTRAEYVAELALGEARLETELGLNSNLRIADTFHFRGIGSLPNSLPFISGVGFDIPVTPQWEHLKALLRDSKDLVERLAGERSLDPLLHAFEDVVTLPLPARVSHSSSRSSSSGQSEQTNLAEDSEEGEEENSLMNQSSFRPRCFVRWNRQLIAGHRIRAQVRV
ncbi:hypothetical protein BT96DRAFT_942276 [Gymnopus androsaceus JB14]|uniref:Uncharacterized protein n=1 Tax=Gymnopus androsaceus JB14 TaxID=1447944 RepID=A0A6A4HDD8_9AGAR|nr:hypothetical protein BT96DRAFT_942276 [Gymnopus androsaceus JB14]